MSWGQVKLKDCCKVVGGATPKREVKEYWDANDYPWVTPKDISKLSTPILEDAPEYISKKGYKACATFLLPKGSVLFTSRAPIGNVAIAGKDMCTNQGFKSLIAGNNVDGLYLYYCMLAHAKKIEALGNGATFKEVPKKTVEEFSIPLPYPDDPEKSLKEQKRIAAILDKADGIRRKRQQAIQLADDFLRSVFLDMFGDPVTNPKGWDIHNIEDVCSHIVDCINKTAKTVDYVTPYKMIRTTNVRNYELDLENCRFAEKDVYEKWVSRLVPEKGDIIFTREAPAGEAAIFNSDEKIFLGQRTMHFRPDQEELNSCFLLYEMMGGGIKRQMEKMSSGSTVKHLSVPECKKFKVRVPPLKLQNKFKKIRDKILELQHSESKSYSFPIFDSISQKAFKGEL